MENNHKHVADSKKRCSGNELIETCVCGATRRIKFRPVFERTQWELPDLNQFDSPDWE